MSTTIKGPDGTAHQSVSCRGKVQRCWEKAAELCPSGYEVSDGSSGVRVVPAIQGSYIKGPIVVQTYDMLIKCKAGS